MPEYEPNRFLDLGLIHVHDLFSLRSTTRLVFVHIYYHAYTNGQIQEGALICLKQWFMKSSE